MKILTLLAVTAALAVGPASVSCATPASAAAGFACCKVCLKGKACGNSCIAEYKTCHKGKGCACNG